MHNLHLWTESGRSSVGKLIMTLVFTMVIGGLSIVPAFGQAYGRHPEYTERREYGHERHEEHREAWRERHAERHWHAYRPYGYAAPHYTPPPVVYAPSPSPGINLFFHIH